ncbi:response regulator transcription factor [Thiolapillus sp.]
MQRTVYLIDDNADFRQSTAWWLEGAGYVVQSFGKPSQAMRYLTSNAVAEHSCLLLDVRMPEMSGLDLHDQLNRSGLRLPVIYMTGHGDVPLAVEAMSKGALTFLEKPLEDEALMSALEAAFVVDANQHAEDREGEACYLERFALLTPREREVLQGIVDGKLNKIIAYDLGISVKTVELHRSRVMKKMQAGCPAALVRMVLTRRVA